MPRIAYVNGAFVPLDQAKVSVLDRGFLFADGIYEVTAVLGRGLVDHEAHLARLKRSLGEIRLKPPVSDKKLTELQLDLIRRNEMSEGLVYLQITRGEADRDFRFPDPAAPATLVMFTQTKALKDNADAKAGIAVKSVPDIRWRRRDIKSVALLAQVLAKQEAADAGCGEAWMVEDGHVTEGSSSSAFIITKDDRIIARPLSNAILPGITRVAVLRLAEEEGLSVEDRAFTLEEARDAAEAFNTSAGGMVMPVISLDGKQIGGGVPGPRTDRLRALYLQMAEESAVRTI